MLIYVRMYVHTYMHHSVQYVYCLLLLCKGVMPPEAEYCIVERLFISSLVAFVTKDHRRKLFVYHFKKGTEICHYTYNDTILAVKLNRQVFDTFIRHCFDTTHCVFGCLLTSNLSKQMSGHLLASYFCGPLIYTLSPPSPSDWLWF